MPKLTKRTVDEAEPSSKPAFVWDSEIKGFGLLVTPRGAKSFILQYRNANGRSRRMTIGRFGTMTPEQARDRARAAIVKIRDGEDPLAKRQDDRGAGDMADLLDRYLKEHAKAHNAPKTYDDVSAIVAQHLKPRIGAIPAKSFSRADAAKLHHAMRDTPRRANHALTILSTALNLAEGWGIRAENSNPCRLVKRYPEKHRTRFLNADEVRRLGEAITEAETIGLPWNVRENEPKAKHLAKPENRRTLMSWQAIAGVRLLLLTGARLSEITELEWSHVDFAAGTIALPAVKGGKREPHPAGAAALAVLQALPRADGARFVLPRESDPDKPLAREVMDASWRRLRARAELEDVRLHDLRHTVGTYAAQAGVSGFIVRDLLRHRNIATTGRYANFDANPVRDVANTVGDRIAAGLSGTPKAEIVMLPIRGPTGAA